MNLGILSRPAFRSATTIGLGLTRARIVRSAPPIFLTARRQVASTVTIIPASQSLDHTAQNIKEESGNAIEDVAKMIAGTIPSATGFVGITRAIASEVPRPVLAFGLAGGLPYLGAGATTVYLAHQAGLAASGQLTASGIDPGVALTILDRALDIQVTYGAVMLSFLGALHWGMEFAGYGGHKGYKRLLLGAAPVLFAWPTLGLQPMTALVVQWAGFAGLWYADCRVTALGWTPKWYSQYRFYLSVIAGVCILGSLAGCSYYGPVAGHGFISRDLELIREERQRVEEEKMGVLVARTVDGIIEAVPAGEDADAFVRIRKRAIAEEK